MGSKGTGHIRHAVVLGLSHATSNASLRDRLMFTESNIPESLQRMCALPEISEALILSTCNRTELYAATFDLATAASALADFLAGHSGVPRGELEPYLYFYQCEQAARHIFRVASSLESLMVEEAQILSQVKSALSVAQECGASGVVLNRLFQFAVTAGKRVRSETKIGEGAVSISQAAVELSK